MLRSSLYYRLKPYLPRLVRMTVRGWLSRRKRAKVGHIWPICPGSEKPPIGWQGWPDGKQFAFVLTHDVEGPAGLANCRRLMELEMKLGFRSSFNFIPAGSYQVPAELREELVRNGFEVGVHDYHHDGHLYSSRKHFLECAQGINRTLKEWGAVGYRSGFMLRNLDWIHELDIAYDSSTFDTDPFEPQPQGSYTIFPFWVPRPGVPTDSAAPRVEPADHADHADQSDPNAGHLRQSASSAGHSGSGYLELPYTLPQDSTLFLLLRESGPDVWIRKLDWIAQRGGMALLNVHPDYVAFEGETTAGWKFPCTHYTALLQHLRNRYQGAYFQATASELTRRLVPVEGRPMLQKPKRIAMITHSIYESDNRVMRYAEALAERGDHVEVLALRQSPDLPIHDCIEKVQLHRIQDRFGRTEKGKLSYLRPTLRFLRRSARWLKRGHRETPFDLVHVHNIPDFLVFAARYPRRHGAKIILDIHDIVPEFFASKFSVSLHSPFVALLQWVERLSARQADHVIISNHLWREKYARRTGTEAKCSVFINHVDSRIFRPHPKRRTGGGPIVIFPGGLQWHQGLDIAIRAFQIVVKEFPTAEFHIYGDGGAKASLVALAKELGLNGSVKFFNPVPMRQVAEIMADADVGVVPKRADSFGDEAYSTKIMEFMSVGVPVVVSSTTIDRYYFNDAVVRFFESGNPHSMAPAMVEVLRDDALRRQMVEKASAYAAEHNWDLRRGAYLKLLDDLYSGK